MLTRHASLTTFSHFTTIVWIDQCSLVGMAKLGTVAAIGLTDVFREHRPAILQRASLSNGSYTNG